MNRCLVVALVAGCGKREAPVTCETVAERAVELIAQHEGTERKALEQWSHAKVLDECKTRPFSARELACAAGATALRALSNCGLYALADLLPPELSCPEGAAPGAPVAEGEAMMIACEKGGKRHGPGVRYLDDSTVIAQLTFANGVLDGPVLLHDTITGAYKAGKRHGTWSLVDEFTATEIVVELVQGVAGGLYSRNVPHEVVTGAWKANRRTGVWTYQWADIGSARGSYANDLRTGEWVFSYPSSTVAARGKYKAGKRMTGWKFFAADGKVLTEKAALAELEWLATAMADDGSADRNVIHAFMTAQ